MNEEKTKYYIPGSTYHLEPDVCWRQQHAKAGNALAMYDVARDCLCWHKFGADGKKALEWLTKAADAGNRGACRELSEIFGRGYVELHVFNKCETVERYPVAKDRETSASYKQRADTLLKALENPAGRVLYGASAGWCSFSPDGKHRMHVSCCVMGDFPALLIEALCNRLERKIPVNVYMDSEVRYDLFVEGALYDHTAFLIHEDLDKRSGPKVRKVECDMREMARQVVKDVESDYYGWTTFNYGHDFAKKENELCRKVARLKRALADYRGLSSRD